MSTATNKLADAEITESRWRQIFRRASDEDSVPTFKTVALGNRGSGKTVFLTAFARNLGVTSDNRRYYLHVEDPAQRKQLDDNYRDLAGGRWPRSTGSRALDFSTYRFNVQVASSTTNAPEHLFDIEWIDYAGEIIDDPNPGTSTDDQFKSHVRDANVVFCLLDGERLRSWIDGEPAGSHYVHHDIHKLVKIAQDVSCSVHVLVTKWDAFVQPNKIFPGDSGQLEMLRAALMHIPGFSDLRSRSIIGQTKRLIPVSAVGPGFVTTDPDGNPVIRSDLNPTGNNLDVPFAAVVLDFLEGAVSQLRPKDERVLKMRGLRHFPGVADTLLSGTTSTLLRQISPEHMLAAGALDLVRLLMKRSPASDTSEARAQTQLIADMRQRLVAFEDQSPASVLGLPAWARRG
jgi:hypothetical protein